MWINAHAYACAYACVICVNQPLVLLSKTYLQAPTSLQEILWDGELGEATYHLYPDFLRVSISSTKWFDSFTSKEEVKIQREDSEDQGIVSSAHSYLVLNFIILLSSKPLLVWPFRFPPMTSLNAFLNFPISHPSPVPIFLLQTKRDLDENADPEELLDSKDYLLQPVHHICMTV